MDKIKSKKKQKPRLSTPVVSCSKGGHYTSNKKPGFSRMGAAESQLGFPSIGAAELQQEAEVEQDNMNTAVVAPLTAVYNKEVRPYIDLIDKLRSEGLDQDVSLPAVAVIGDQSAGKSSTLEAISGIQLPRGSGIVTRCPLVLRLKSSVSGDQQWKGRIHYQDSDGEHYDEDLHSPTEVGDRVVEAQNRIAGTDKGISDSLITLDVESRDVPDLTLIDLPGITRVAVPGQPEDIPEQIKRLIKARIKKKETIILAVIPANVDIATTEALQMAQEIDKDGSRTLGVVTKPDLIDRGTESDLIAVVTNQRVPLVKGYTVVKCRGQESITRGQTLSDALQAEQRFFEDAEHFREVDPHLLGVRNLSKKLTDELVSQIKKSMPKLKDDVSRKKDETTKKLMRLGKGIPHDDLQKKLFLLEILQGFCDQIVEVCKGDYGTDCPQELRLFTQARRHYEKLISNMATETPAEDSPLVTSTYIQTIMRESQDARAGELPRFINYRVFQKMVIEIVRRYETHCSVCLEHVDRLVDRIITGIAHRHFMQFPRLGGEIKLTVSKLRKSARETCGQRISELFDMECLVYTQDRIFNHDLDTVHETHRRKEEVKKREFIKEYQKRNKEQVAPFSYHTQPVEQQSKQEVLSYGHQLTSSDGARDQSDYAVKKQEAQDMYSMIRAYLEVCTRRMVDYVPMTIQLHLVRRLSEAVRLHVMGMLTDPDTLAFIYENPSVVSERDAMRRKLERLIIAEEELVKF